MSKIAKFKKKIGQNFSHTNNLFENCIFLFIKHCRNEKENKRERNRIEK